MSYQVQKEIEHKYNDARINALIDEDLQSVPELNERFDTCLLHCAHLMSDHGYLIDQITITDLIIKALRVMALNPKQMGMSSLVGMIRHSDDDTLTEGVSAIIYAMAEHDLIELSLNRFGFVDLYPVFLCDEEIQEEANYIGRMPPMIVEPLPYTHNESSPYVTGVRHSVLLQAKAKGHDGDLALDALNMINRVSFRLDADAIDEPDPEHTYLLENGNKFNLVHNPDNRGRLYSKGYKTDYQGDDYAKSLIDFHDSEIIEGF